MPALEQGFRWSVHTMMAGSGDPPAHSLFPPDTAITRDTCPNLSEGEERELTGQSGAEPQAPEPAPQHLLDRLPRGP